MDPEAAAEAAESGGEPMTFAMADGTLTINTGVTPDSLNKIADSSGGSEMIGPDGNIPPEAAAQMQMAAGMMQGLRMGAYIRIDGGIAETNAKHVDGTPFDQPDRRPHQMLDTVSNLNGVKMETQEQVTVKFE